MVDFRGEIDEYFAHFTCQPPPAGGTTPLEVVWKRVGRAAHHARNVRHEGDKRVGFEERFLDEGQGYLDDGCDMGGPASRLRDATARLSGGAGRRARAAAPRRRPSAR
jgi:hypothetical protein